MQRSKMSHQKKQWLLLVSGGEQREGGKKGEIFLFGLVANYGPTIALFNAANEDFEYYTGGIYYNNGILSFVFCVCFI